jgi:hypothetical protein
MASGGYRQPSNPAPVSGPGALSQRTDGGATEGLTQPQQTYTGMPYGQNKSVNEQQASAPMAGNPMPMPELTPLTAPTMRPNEAITSGINRGEGPGTEAMRGLPNRAPALADTIKHLTQFDSSGDAELIYRQLLDNGY